MKRILMVIVLCVASLDISARVVAFDSRVAAVCSKCGAQLSYQELLFNQILLAGKGNVTFLCDACRAEAAKGKKEKEAAIKEFSAALVSSINQELYHSDTFSKTNQNKVDLRKEVLRKAFLKKQKKEEENLLKPFTLSLLVPVQQVTSGGYRLSLLSSERLLLESADGALVEIKSPDRTCNSRTGQPVSYFTISGIDAVGDNGKFLLFSKQARSKDTPVDDEDVKTVFEFDAADQIFTLLAKPKVSFIKNSSDIPITVEDYD